MASTIEYVDRRGVRNLFAAEVLVDTAEKFECDTPFEVCGVATLSRTTETSSGTKYYNNQPTIVIKANGGDEVEIEGSAIPDDVLAKLMGEYYDETTGMYVEGEPVTKYFAIGYITKKTDGSEMFVWRLKGTFGYPDEENNTEDDGTDSNGDTIVYTGVNTMHKFAKTGKTAKAARLPAAKFAAGEDAFFAEVQTPDTIAAQ